MALSLAILQSNTLVVLKHPMPPTELSLAEAAVTHDALRSVSTGFEVASWS